MPKSSRPVIATDTSPSKNALTSVLDSRERFGASLCRAAFHGAIWFAFCNGDWRSLDKGYAAGRRARG